MRHSSLFSRLMTALWASFLCSALFAIVPTFPAQAGSGSSSHDDDEAPEVEDTHEEDDDDDDRDSDREEDRDDDGDRDRDSDADKDLDRSGDDDRSGEQQSDSRDDDKTPDDDSGRDDSGRDDRKSDDDKSRDDKGGREDKSRDDSKDRQSSGAQTSDRSSSSSRSGRSDDSKDSSKSGSPSARAAGTAGGLFAAPEATGSASAAQPSSEARAERGDQLLEIAENKRGERVREGELLLISASKATQARLIRGGYRIIQSFPLSSLGLRGYRVAIPRKQGAEQALARLRRIDPRGIASFNHIYVPARGGATVAALPTDTTSASRARQTSAKIGLVDAPVNEKHPMLGTVKVEARSFGLAIPAIDSHGTAVASRLAEAAPGARIFVASVFSESRGGEEVASVDAITRALDWLARNRIPVINLSLAGPPNPVLEAVTSRLVGRGYKLVAAVGNEGPNADAQYPAAYDGVVGVTAVDRRNQVYIYANQGDYVDFAAPGVDTTVAGPDGHTETVSGTSYAAPVIAAELARRLTRPDRVMAVRAEKELADSATDLGEPGRDPVFGFGVIAPPET